VTGDRDVDQGDVLRVSRDLEAGDGPFGFVKQLGRGDEQLLLPCCDGAAAGDLEEVGGGDIVLVFDGGIELGGRGRPLGAMPRVYSEHQASTKHRQQSHDDAQHDPEPATRAPG